MNDKKQWENLAEDCPWRDITPHLGICCRGNTDDYGVYGTCTEEDCAPFYFATKREKVLDEIYPDERHIISLANYEEIWFATGELNELTDEQILELTRCGVRYDEEFDCLGMLA